MKLVDRLRETADMLHQAVGTETDEANVRAAIARIEAADPWARFGEAVFDAFWCDGDPGDIEGGDLQEIARECGLLCRADKAGENVEHGEWCEWEPGKPLSECECWFPSKRPFSSLVREQDGGGHE